MSLDLVKRLFVLLHWVIVDVAICAQLEPPQELILDRPIQKSRLLCFGLPPLLAHLEPKNASVCGKQVQRVCVPYWKTWSVPWGKNGKCGIW